MIKYSSTKISAESKLLVRFDSLGYPRELDESVTDLVVGGDETPVGIDIHCEGGLNNYCVVVNAACLGANAAC